MILIVFGLLLRGVKDGWILRWVLGWGRLKYGNVTPVFTFRMCQIELRGIIRVWARITYRLVDGLWRRKQGVKVSSERIIISLKVR